MLEAHPATARRLDHALTIFIEVRLLSGAVVRSMHMSLGTTAGDVRTALCEANTLKARSSKLLLGVHELCDEEPICSDGRSALHSPIVLHLVRIGVRSDGFYIRYADCNCCQYSKSVHGQCASVLRFYTDDRTVLQTSSVFVPGEEAYLLKWFHRDGKNSCGVYELGINDDIEFAISGSQGVMLYKGAVENDAVTLRMHSLATGMHEEETYTFLSIEAMVHCLEK